MDQVIKQHFGEIITLFAVVLGAVLTALYKIGWLNFGVKIKNEEWDGSERRECVNHPQMTQKVCALYTKLEQLDIKLDTVSEKLHHVLGRIEGRWGRSEDT